MPPAQLEDVMTGYSQTDEGISEQSAAASPNEAAAAANKRGLQLIFGTQKLLLDELIFVASELFERLITETRLFTELVSKASGAHSVAGFRELGQECGQHQIDFIRRDCERVFKHSDRMLEATSKLIVNRTTD
jgi:hypothetical protein